MFLRVGLLSALACAGLFSQTPDSAQPPLAFEVASVKPAELPGASSCQYRLEGGPGTPDPGRIHYSGSLATLLKLTYFGNVHACKSYVLSAPRWLDSEGFDVQATLPAGTAQPQLWLMMQRLLAERFKLAIHREPRSISAYKLVIGKNCPKFSASIEKPASVPSENPPKMTRDPEGFPAPPPRGSWESTRNGHTRMQLENVDVPALARRLQLHLAARVADATGLPGRYDFVLSWFDDSSSTAAPSAGPDIFAAVQEQLGLKLEGTRTPIGGVVVDHVEKVPAGN